MHSSEIILIFTIIALMMFTFTYWKDATEEGFGSDSIFDSIFIILVGGILGGKFLFRSISFEFFQYEFIRAPLIMEGVLVGGAIAAYFVIKKNHWSIWKIGDMIAPALALFQAVVFLGFWVVTQDLASFTTFILFAVLFIIIRLLKKKKALGISAQFHERKRLDRLVFTGGLLAVYLTGSSLIAMLFLLIRMNPSSKFWWFQVFFYILILVTSLLAIRKQLLMQEVSMTPIKTAASSFMFKMKSILKKRKKDIQTEQDKLKQKDPFIQESTDGFRNVDDSGEEATDLREHSNIAATKKELKEEEKAIKDSLENIEEGTYGTCKKCGNKINKERLEAYHTAELCVKCARS